MNQPLAGAQAPNRDVKMPPLGHFNVKDSVKEGKKRRGGPGAPSGTLASGISATPGPDAGRVSDVGRFSTIQNGNVNKVGFSTRYEANQMAYLIDIESKGPPCQTSRSACCIAHACSSTAGADPTDLLSDAVTGGTGVL